MKQNYQMKIFLCLELLLYQLQFKLLAFSPRTHHEFAKLCNLLFLCDLLNGTRPDLLHGLKTDAFTNSGRSYRYGLLANLPHWTTRPGLPYLI